MDDADDGAAELVNAVLSHSFTSTDDEAEADEIAMSPEEVKGHMGGIEPDEPDKSYISGTANLEKFPIVPELSHNPNKMSWAATDPEVCEELNVVMFAQQGIAGEYVHYVEEDIQHHSLHPQVREGFILQDKQAQRDSLVHEEGCMARKHALGSTNWEAPRGAATGSSVVLDNTKVSDHVDGGKV